MDATVRISDKGPGRSFMVEITGMDQIPWTDKLERIRVRSHIQNCFWKITNTECNIEVLFGDECPACSEELKDGKCSDPTCIYNYEG